mgnify:CR=1 FL=1
MKKILGFAGAIALSIIPTPSFSGEVEQKEMMSVTEQLLPQIGEKYKNLDIKEKKAYKEALINYLEDVQKTGATGVGEAFRRCAEDRRDRPSGTVVRGGMVVDGVCRPGVRPGIECLTRCMREGWSCNYC